MLFYFVQAYYNSAGTPPLPPPAFFHSPIPSSPHTHPYMWGQVCFSYSSQSNFIFSLHTFLIFVTKSCQ